MQKIIDFALIHVIFFFSVKCFTCSGWRHSYREGPSEMAHFWRGGWGGRHCHHGHGGHRGGVAMVKQQLFHSKLFSFYFFFLCYLYIHLVHLVN